MTAVNTTKDVISIYGTCAQPNPNDPEIPFCCEHDQANGHGIQTFDLIGTDKTEELMTLTTVDLLTGQKLDLEKHSTVAEMLVTVQGNAGNEAIRGSNHPDPSYLETLFGGAGVDSIRGGDGDDVLYGGSEGDHLWGEGGDDLIRGDAGIDFMHGGDGHDRLYGGSEGDFIRGDAHNDTIWGNRGTDEIRGGGGNDTIYGGNHDDTIWGGDNDDTVLGQHGADRIHGDDGDDDLSGGVGEDWLWGDADNDKLHGGAGEDNVYGGDGVDWLYGGYDSDDVRGDGGNDVICENQSYTGAPGGTQGAVARNYMSGGLGFDVLHLDTYYYFSTPTEPLHLGDRTIEEGYFDVNVVPDEFFESTGSRLGDYNPNAAECVALVSMFGQ